MVADIDGHDVAVLRARVGFVAALAAPLPGRVLDHFLVAVVRQAGRVGEVLLLDVDDRRLAREVIRRVRHAELFLLDLQDGLVRVAAAAGGGGERAAHHVGVRAEGVVLALRVVPAFQLVRVVDVRVDGHGARTQQAEAPAAEVGDFDPLEGDDGFEVGVEGRGGVAPDGQAHGVAGVVDEGELALLVRFAGGFGDDLGHVGNLFEHPDSVDGGVFFDRLEIADVGEVEANLRHILLLFGLRRTVLAVVDVRDERGVVGIPFPQECLAQRSIHSHC